MQLLGNILAVPQMVKHRVTIGPATPPKSIESRDLKRYLYTHVPSSIIHTSQRVETMHHLMGGSIHTMEYDSAIKRRGVLTHATAWMDLKT